MSPWAPTLPDGRPDLPAWPNCATVDCSNKRCMWSGTDLCFPCAEQVVGHDEMVRRYNATHDITWDEAERRAGRTEPR